VPTITGSTKDPEFRHRRAVIAGRASHTVDALITKLVNRADELTPDHVERIRAALPPVDDDREASAA